MATVLALLLGTGCSPQARKARHLEQAEKYFAAGQFDQAEIEYLNVLHLDPSTGQAIGRLGEIYFEQGRAGQVFPYLARARDLQPDNVDWRLKIGLFYLSSGKAKAARDEAAFVLDHRPADPDAPLLLAETAFRPDEIAEVRQRLQKLPAPLGESAPVLVALGALNIREHNFKEAEAAFRRALAIDPKSDAAWSALGALHWAQNDLPAAEEAFAAAANLAPERSAKRLQYAQFELQQGKADAARRLLTGMTAKTPDYLPAWMLLAELSAREKKYAESATFNERVLARDPVHLEALILAGRLKMETGEPAQAVAKLEAAQKLYPQAVPLRYQLALAYLGNGDVGQASASLTQAIATAPDFTEAIVLLASINIRRGDAKGAIIALKQLVDKHPEALTRAWFLLAEAYRAVGDFDEAVAVYHRADQANPGNPETSWLMGVIFIQQNRRKEAREAFNQALEKSPDYLPALEQLVDLDLAEKKPGEAMQRIDRRLEKSPGVAGLYLLRAKVHLARSEPKPAEVALLKAVQLQPDSATPYFMLARLYVSTNQQEKALANLQEVVTKNPRDVQALMLSAVIHDQQKDFAGARDNYEKLLAINPKFSPALNNLAYLYSEQFKQLDKAYEMAQRARELLPNEPHAADTLGWIVFQKRQYPWALSLLQESATKLPESAEVQFHLGMAHYMMGEEDAARVALQRALQLDKDFAGRDQATESLALLAMDPATAGAAARANLERIVASRPDDPVALTRLAAVEEHAGETEKAIAADQAALKVSPKNVGALLGLARLYSAHHESGRAFELARNARQLAPDDPAVAHLLGRLAYESGNYSWALSLLQDAAKQKPDDPEVLYDLSLAEFSLGQVAAAEESLHAALEKNPLSPRAAEARLHLDLIAVAAHPGRDSSAAEKTAQMLKNAPDDGPALVAQAALADQRQDIVAAEQAYEKVLARFPGFAPAAKRLAVLYSASPDDNKKALEFALKAREIYPSDPELDKILGLAVFRQGDFARAATLLGEASLARNSDAECFFYLGLAQDRLKDRAASRKSLQHALELNLKPDLAVEARRVLGAGN